MAEQAINTIYLLGEQPDALCDDIIKGLTRAVFNSDHGVPAVQVSRADSAVAGSAPSSPTRDRSAAGEEPPSSGDVAQAFHLSQLVFLVGHVAFKHIVYLELVEREIKRRKEVLAKGMCKVSIVGFTQLTPPICREKARTGLEQVDKQQGRRRA